MLSLSASHQHMRSHNHMHNQLTCLEQMLSPRPVPPRLRGFFMSSSVPCTYSLNKACRPSCVMPMPASRHEKVCVSMRACVWFNVKKMLSSSYIAANFISQATPTGIHDLEKQPAAALHVSTVATTVSTAISRGLLLLIVAA